MVTTVRNSCQWLALRKLSYLGIPDFASAPTTAVPDSTRNYLTDGMLDEIAGIQTASLQDIFEDGPAALSQVDFGVNLYAPTTITLNVVQNQGFVTLPAGGGYLPWMNGCSVLIQGDSFLNEWANNTGLLRRPYMGATANGVQATVFGNAVELPQDVKNVLEPVRAGFHSPLTPCGSRLEYDELSGCHFFSSFVRQGMPRHFLVESRYDATLDYLQTFLRVAPVPMVAQPLAFIAKLNPYVVTVDDLGDNDTDPGTLVNIPGRWIESIFLPYCLQRFTGTALFKNETVKPEIARQYQEAKKKLAGFRPQISRKGGAIAYRP